MKRLATILFLVVSFWSCRNDEVSIEEAPKTLYHSIKNYPQLEVIKRNVTSLLSTENVRTDQDFLELLNWEKVRIESFAKNSQIYALGYLFGDNKLKNVFITDIEGNLIPYYIEIDKALFQSPLKEDIDALNPPVQVIDLLSNQEWTFETSTTNSSGRIMIDLNCHYELSIEEWQGVNYSAGGVSYSEPEVTYTIVLVCDGGSGEGGDPFSGGSGGGSGNEREIPVVTELCPEGYVWVEDDCYPVCSEEAMDTYVEICEDEKPCENDPLIEMEISPWNQGKNSNRFGCVRVDPLKTCENISGKRMHAGIDLKADIGTNIYSIKSGTVFSKNYGGGWGNYIIIKSDDLYFLYAHLREIPEISGSVSKGQFIGVSGESQTVGEPHLHIEVRKQTSNESYNNMQKVDIENYLGSDFDSNGEKTDDNCL